MHGIEILFISVLVTFAQGTNSSWFPNWQSSWIQGGIDAAPGEFPYMVSVRSLEPRNVLYCGGSIINNWYIMTTAHCVKGRTVGVIIVVVGTNKLTSGGQTYSVSHFIMHEAFDPSQHSNDIALLRLTMPITYSATVMPVTLSNQDEQTAVGTSCALIGWGETSRCGPAPLNQNLQKLHIKVISNSVCKKFFKFISDKKICGFPDSGKGGCGGDSGGPLICGGKQIGIYTGGGPTSTIHFPVECLSVAKYIDWIKQHAV